MSQTNIELARSPGGLVVGYPFGQFRARINRADIVGELRSRNYLGCETGRAGALGQLGQTYTTTSRTSAISRAVDDSLTRHSKPKTCSGSGCYLSDAMWDSVVSLAVLLANQYYKPTTTVSPAYTTPWAPFSPYPVTVESPTPYTTYVYGGGSPVPGVPWVTETVPYSPTAIVPGADLQRLFSQYFQGVPNLGQAAPAPGGEWTTEEKWSFALDLLSKGMAWASTYLQSKAERDRLLAMGTQIPQLTADEVNKLLMQYKMLNPGTTDEKLNQVGAGLFGQPKPSAIPTWVWPVAAGLGAVAVMTLMQKRR
jgi:hypothetical protein